MLRTFLVSVVHNSCRRMSTFKKVQVVKLSSNYREATQVVQVPLTPPTNGQVLIKNHFSGTNATDINISAGRYFTDGKIPFDVGLEGCGVVESVGTGVSKYSPGQPVLYFGSSGYSEYIYASEEQLLPIPELKAEYLALVVTGLTAAIGLDVAGQIKSGEKVLITAAAGGTGQTCVQYAKGKGCFVIGTTSSDEKGEFLKSIGCDHVINYRKTDLFEELKKSYPKGVDVIWETIGGETFEKLIDHLAIHGRMVIVGGITGYKTVGFPSIKIQNLPSKLVMNSTSLTGFFLPNERDKYAEYFKKLVTMYSSGQLKIRLDKGEKSPEGPFRGVDSVVRAVEYLHTGKNKGKVYVALRE